jgi:hypothetical protein
LKPAACGLQRVVARFHFRRAHGESRSAVRSFLFARGDQIRLFFSYRYTSGAAFAKSFGRHGLEVSGEWIARFRTKKAFFFADSKEQFTR